jgi:hypothetical protein
LLDVTIFPPFFTLADTVDVDPDDIKIVKKKNNPRVTVLQLFQLRSVAVGFQGPEILRDVAEIKETALQTHISPVDYHLRHNTIK